MSVTPLTPAQQTAVDALETAGRLRKAPPDETRAELFLGHAADALADLPNLTRVQNKYDLAYNGAHDTGEAMLAAYGYRTASGHGQHEALGRFLESVFDSPPENAAAGHYDTMRRERNQLRYAARAPSVAAASAATSAASTLYTAARGRVT